MAQRLEDQPDRLPATRGTAIDADVCRGSQELGLRSGLGSSGAVLSRQWALVFSQKMIAGMLPPFAAANKKPHIVALASATPRSRSARNRLRSVFGAQPMILAMSS